VLDVVIRGGEVIDGTGARRRRADVGIHGGRIARIGEVPEEAARTIDATGKLVTPGFIDVHTHFDAQVFWDPALSPSPLHGVTTAIAGNCGFTIAPLSDVLADRDYVQRMLARVEGMPLETLQAGVPWTWTSTAEYLDRIERAGIGINLGFMVGHSAIRRVVMGPEATRRESTPDELAAMQDVLRAGLEAGGLGFSSSYARTHNDDEGNMVPSRYASAHELVELARVTGEFEGTGLAIIPQLGAPFHRWAVDLMTDMSVAARRPINWNAMIVSAANLGDCLGKLAASDDARAKGGRIAALVMPLSAAPRLTFHTAVTLDAMPDWEAPMLAPRDERLALLRDPGARQALNAKAQTPENPLLSIANWATHRIYDTVNPDNEQYRGRIVGEIAAEQGRDAWDVLCDIAVADDLMTSFGPVAPTPTEEDWKARVAVIRDHRAVVGASDAGAHFDLLATFNYATGLLQAAVREHQLLSFEDAIHFMTQVQAELYGIRERGLLRDGWYADVVVLDPTTVASGDVTMRYDLPGGYGRLYADSRGIDHVLVNGEAIVRDGALTPARRGVLLRGGRDTSDPALD
jgi:N-acyl-D-aspartate/D-glutamate deacylase